MYTKLIIVLIIALMLACVKAKGADQLEEVQVYAKLAMRVWGKPGAPTNVEFQMVDDLPNTYSAACMRGTGGRKGIIYVKKADWAEYKYFSRLWLITHELGHCTFNLEHSNNPYDIMYPTVATNNGVAYTAISLLAEKQEKRVNCMPEGGK